MSDTRLYVQCQPFTLAGSGCTAGDTTLIITSPFAQIAGTLFAMTDFGTKGYGTCEPGTQLIEESVTWTGVTQNANGTATLTGVSTQLMVAPYTETAGVKFSHAGGTKFVVTNTAGFYDNFANKSDDETIVNKWTFPTNGNWPIVDNSATLPSADAQLATKKYVDGVAIAGAPNASDVTKGITFLSSAPAVAVTPTALNSEEVSATTGANKVVRANAGGKISSGFGGSASTVATLDAGTLVVQNPANATATPTASKIPIADGSGKLDGWISAATVTKVIDNSLTTGEAIDGSMTPQAICVKASDGKSYKAKANDTTLLNAYAFVTTNALITTTPTVITGGIVPGFTGLVKGAMYYVTDTAGTISTTPSATTIIPIGRAVSATQIELSFGKKVQFAAINDFNTAISGTTDTTITVGFRPERIDVAFNLQIDGNGTDATYVVVIAYFQTTQFITSIVKTSTTGSAPGVGTVTATPQVFGAGSGGNDSTTTISMNSVSDTAAVWRTVNTITAGTGGQSKFTSLGYIAYE